MGRGASGNEDLSDVQDLEKINEIVDLCIDSELYDYLRKIIPDESLDKRALKELNSLREGKELEKFPQRMRKYSTPVKSVIYPSELPDGLIRPTPSNIIPLLSGNQLLKHWSKLFWAKLIRAEIKRLNRTKWLAIYDDLNLYLESNIPAKDAELKSWKITFLNYLMELSAIGQGDASIGYAERGRNLIGHILGNDEEVRGKRNNYGDPYDRWIWYNKAVAYQHMGRNQDAARQFDTMIGKFNKEVAAVGYDVEKNIEFLLNVVPAIRQRSEANLQLQLNYHALQFLAEGSISERLSTLSIETEFYKKIVERLRIGVDLLKLEALLKLEEDDKVNDLFGRLYESIFPATDWLSAKYGLPGYRFSTEDPALSSQVRLIEHTIAWYLGEANRLVEDLKYYEDFLKSYKDLKGTAEDRDSLASKINDNINWLIKRIDSVREQYWSWVEDNEFDEKIYFSRWALFLGICAKIVGISVSLPSNSEINDNSLGSLFLSLMKLYNERRASLPYHRNKRPPNGAKTIKLETLRSDDLPDIEKGLNDFYSELLKIRDKEKYQELIAKVLDPSGRDPFGPLKEDHLRVLEALDDYDTEFGERQKVKSLMRCNMRSRWNESSNCLSLCKCKEKCWQSSGGASGKKGEPFYGLLECCKDTKPAKRNENRECYKLNGNDYQIIMSLAETEFTKRLEKASEHAPNNTLHFLGLQRWNSLTPAQGRSVGGGYFLYRTGERGIIDLGIAIDPGFDFVRNFLRGGFSIRDIDLILISHAHADHLWDFESIVQLLKELDEKKHIKHRINVILTLGAYEKFERHIINNRALREFIEPYLIDVRKGIDLDFFSKLGMDRSGHNGSGISADENRFCFQKVGKKAESERTNDQWRWKPVLPSFSGSGDSDRVEIWPTCAYHDDYSNISDSFGFIINIDQQSKKLFSFGYTGDTRWVGDELYNKKCYFHNDPGKWCKNNDDIQEHWGNIASQYRNCNVILVHIGSLIDHKKSKKFADYGCEHDCDQLIRDKNHPYLIGMMRLLSNTYRAEQDKLILVGEFGEELRGGIRVNIVQRLQAALTPTWPVIPVDVGLDVVLNKFADNEKNYSFICALCDQPRSIGDKENGCFSSKIAYHCYGHDEAIFYICDTCYKSIPEDVRQNKLRQLYETGREIRTEPDSRG